MSIRATEQILCDTILLADNPVAMQNADDMLKQILKEVDTNEDGKIQYEGMKVWPSIGALRSN